jgi:hypothetical protein
MYRSERAFLLRDFRRIAAKIYPALVKPTLTVTMTVITATKAMTVGIAAAMAEGFLLRIDVHFKFVPREAIGLRRATLRMLLFRLRNICSQLL